MPTSYHLTFLRHGQSEGNVRRLFQGQNDYPLTALGRAQAQALAERWQTEERAFDHVIASPLSRAYETAKIVAQALNLPLETDPLWMERHFGEVSAKKIEDYYQNGRAPAFEHPYLPFAQTGESRVQALTRAMQALQNILTRPPGRYLIVSHGAILNMALFALYGIPAQANLEGPRFHFGNTSFASFTYTPETHRWQTHVLNDHQHTAQNPPDFAPPYQFTFVRHGQSTGNEQHVWQGQADYPLTTLGRAQARALGQSWQAAGLTFDRAIASPLSRAHETAEIIAAALDTPLEADPIWMERDNGSYAGTTSENRHPPEPDFYHPYLPVGKTGESLWGLYLRGGQALSGLLNRPPGRYLIVSHGGTLNAVLTAALGITPQANFRGARFSFGNTSFAHLTYTPQFHQWRVYQFCGGER